MYLRQHVWQSCLSLELCALNMKSTDTQTALLSIQTSLPEIKNIYDDKGDKSKKVFGAICIDVQAFCINRAC